MCRWAAYIGDAVFLEDIVSAPCHSLIAQSHCATEAKTATNADGFGLAWYGERPEPGFFRDILPAWSDPNLKSLCRQIRSSLFLAHVRASTGGATSRVNCHPFINGRWSFMHNGQIGDFDRIRRKLEASLGDQLYDQIEGTT
ncbi:MAG: class II glutamine amidotransferase, partial [Mesorhizobium sp.]|nr:class II glutamine amidotransferase [Mesorhizobium sp.]